MSSFFLLNNVVGPAVPLRGGVNGHPTKFKFWEDLSITGGSPIPKEGYTGGNVCRVPDDNGDSWTVEDAREEMRGAHLYLEILGAVNMVEVSERLHRAKINQTRIFEQAIGGPTHGEGDLSSNILGGPTTEPTTEDTTAPLPKFDPADTDRDGTVTKQERKRFEHENG